MDHFLDFRLLPDPEFSSATLMNALFAKLHRSLVEINNRQLGISFPDVKPSVPTLGHCLRLHGTIDSLKPLLARNWLAGMRDHVTAGEIERVREGVSYCRVRRVQVKSNAERQRRRYYKRHPEAREVDVISKMPDTAERKVTLPFVRVRSQSTGQQFCLFLEHLPPQSHPIAGEFNSYGLSANATVPWF